MSKCECKECIHNDVCKYEVVHSTKGCDHYKSKSLCVEVVRCKDCQWWEAHTYGSTVGRCENPRNGLFNEYTEEDDYCSYVERKLKEVGE